MLVFPVLRYPHGRLHFDYVYVTLC